MTQTMTGLDDHPVSTAEHRSAGSTRAARPPASGAGRRRRRQRRQVAGVLLFLGLTGAYLDAAVFDDAPAWQDAVPERQVLETSESGQVSAELVGRFESALANRSDSVDVTFWWDTMGEDAVAEAFLVARVLNPEVELEGFEVVSDGSATRLSPTYSSVR